MFIYQENMDEFKKLQLLNLSTLTLNNSLNRINNAVDSP